MKFSAAILLLSLVQIATCNAQWTPKVVPVTLPQPAAAPAALAVVKVKMPQPPVDPNMLQAKHASDAPTKEATK